MSLPSRERGLKFNSVNGGSIYAAVALFTGAWIETLHGRAQSSPLAPSLPSRERGLKYRQVYTFPLLYRRSLRGSVD